MSDKQLHFAISFVITLAISVLTNVYIGVAVAIVAGVGKEMCDYYGNGTPEVGDLIADAGGIVLAVLLLKGV